MNQDDKLLNALLNMNDEDEVENEFAKFGEPLNTRLLKLMAQIEKYENEQEPEEKLDLKQQITQDVQSFVNLYQGLTPELESELDEILEEVVEILGY
jgi:predicted nucleic acid-binding OB-fold protein